MRLHQRCTTALALALTLTLLSFSAQAGIVQIFEPAVEGDTTWTLVVSGIPTGGAGTNGTFQVGGTAEAATFIYASNRVNTANQTFTGVLFEDIARTIVSDIFRATIVEGPNFINIQVTSDIEGSLLQLPPAFVGVVEDGTPQFMFTTTYTDGTTDDFFLQSAVEQVPVPEPSTITLLGIGIVGMAGYRWRKRKQAAA